MILLLVDKLIGYLLDEVKLLVFEKELFEFSGVVFVLNLEKIYFFV